MLSTDGMHFSETAEWILRAEVIAFIRGAGGVRTAAMGHTMLVGCVKHPLPRSLGGGLGYLLRVSGGGVRSFSAGTRRSGTKREDKMIKFKGIIFDLDGVICSTDRYHYQAWKRAVAPLGVEFNERINNRLRGVSRRESLQIILERYAGTLSERERKEICETKNAYYRELLADMSEKDLSGEVSDTLIRLKGSGVKIAVGSSSKNTKLILGKLGILGLFDAIADGNDIVRSKPDPEVFLKAAEKLGESPRDCAVVEDAVSGIEAAKAGGFYAIAISDATRSPLADRTLRTLSDLLEE